jgi:hypothetical protein
MSRRECGVWGRPVPPRLSRGVLESSAKEGDSPVGVSREGSGRLPE